MKFKKKLIVLLVVVIAGLVGGFCYANSRLETVTAEHDKAVSDKEYYTSKRYECSGTANTTSSTVNSASLTDCGGDMAVQSLKFKSLSDIYHNYCYMGFGAHVYGCTNPITKTVYVCAPGTSVYDKKFAYSTWYYNYYRVTSYSCSLSQSHNTIRHELLHLVYADLSFSEKSKVDNALAPYKSMYASELSLYPATQQDDELFVRVGADGRRVNDIELVDLYSKVSSVYTAQKQSYYRELASTADGYIDKYKGLRDEYSFFCAIAIIFIILNIGFLIAVMASRYKVKSKKSIFDEDEYEDDDEDLLEMDDYDPDDDYLDYLQQRIDEMNQKNSKNTAREFEEFKQKYGIIDVEDDE